MRPARSILSLCLWTLLPTLAASACTERTLEDAPPRVDAKDGGDAKVATPGDAKVATPDVPAGDWALDKAELDAPADASESEVGGTKIAARSDGPWTIRSSHSAAGSADADDVWGGLVGSEVGEAYGVGGLGLVGTGRGGGGTGEGTIGLGTTGLIGKGGGGGTGRGYGSGSGAGFGGRSASAMKAKERAPSSRPRPEPSGMPAQGPLKAGSTDDNADFKGFLAYLDKTRADAGVKQFFQDADVRERRFIAVTNAAGDPLPGARVAVVDPDTGRTGWLATTYGDGAAPFYPGLAFPEHVGRPPATYHVEVDYAGTRRRVEYNAAEERLTVTLDAAPASDQLALDVLFLIDTTGSMSDEIAQIKSTLLNVTGRVRGLQQGISLRYGAVLFRDLGDEYVTKAHPFTDDIQAFDQALQSIYAGGGGDYPESVNQGLDQAVTGMQWGKGAAKVVFLIGDAPPHTDYQGDAPYIASAINAVARGIRIHAVAASGLEPKGSPSFRQVAQLTRGKFIFIEYGGDIAASAAKHGVSGPTKSNNLDDIIFEQVKLEVAGWGKRT
ncbi:MAG: VWA domain-containing protein [Nannocystaceae bacterium]